MILYRAFDIEPTTAVPGYRVKVYAGCTAEGSEVETTLYFGTPSEVVQWCRETSDAEKADLLREIKPTAGLGNVNWMIYEDTGSECWVAGFENEGIEPCLTHTGHSSYYRPLPLSALNFALGPEAKLWPAGRRVLAARSTDGEAVVLDVWSADLVETAAKDGFDRFILLPTKIA